MTAKKCHRQVGCFGGSEMTVLMARLSLTVAVAITSLVRGLDHNTFDPGLHQTSPSNIGGWCASHGNVACILAEVCRYEAFVQRPLNIGRRMSTQAPKLIVASQ